MNIKNIIIVSSMITVIVLTLIVLLKIIGINFNIITGILTLLGLISVTLVSWQQIMNILATIILTIIMSLTFYNIIINDVIELKVNGSEIVEKKVLSEKLDDLNMYIKNPQIQDMTELKKYKTEIDIIKSLTNRTMNKFNLIIPKGNFNIYNDKIVWKDNEVFNLNIRTNIDLDFNIDKIKFISKDKVKMTMKIDTKKMKKYNIFLTSNIKIKKGILIFSNIEIKYENDLLDAAKTKNFMFSDDAENKVTSLVNNFTLMETVDNPKEKIKQIIMTQFQDEEYYLLSTIERINNIYKSKNIELDLIDSILKKGFNKLIINEKDNELVLKF